MEEPEFMRNVPNIRASLEASIERTLADRLGKSAPQFRTFDTGESFFVSLMYTIFEESLFKLLVNSFNSFCISDNISNWQ